MKGLRLGDSARLTRTFTAEDVAAYRELARDPGAGAGETLVPAPLLAGLISCLLGTRLPGLGTNWLKQQLRFLAPARVGQAITAEVETIRFRPEKELVNLRTICTDAAGELLLDGEALVLVRDLRREKGETYEMSSQSAQSQLPSDSTYISEEERTQ